jgi:beta-galactosidase
MSRFGIGPDNPADIDIQMYTHPDAVVRIGQSANRTKPFYLCEYAHAMNNSMGSIGEYNDAFDKYPSLMGGAIWEWEDQGIWNRRDPNHVFLAYGGGFGEVPNDHYFIHKGVVFSDRTPKPPTQRAAYRGSASSRAIGKRAVKIATSTPSSRSAGSVPDRHRRRADHR